MAEGIKEFIYRPVLSFVWSFFPSGLVAAVATEMLVLCTSSPFCFLQRSRPGCAESGDFVQLLGGNGIDTSKLLPITDLCISFTGPSECKPDPRLVSSGLPRRLLTWHLTFVFCFIPPALPATSQLTWRSAVKTRWWGWCPAGSSSAGCLSATGYWTTRSCRPSNSTTWKISVSITDPSRNHEATNVLSDIFEFYFKGQYLTRCHMGKSDVKHY